MVGGGRSCTADIQRWMSDEWALQARDVQLGLIHLANPRGLIAAPMNAATNLRWNSEQRGRCGFGPFAYLTAARRPHCHRLKTKAQCGLAAAQRRNQAERMKRPASAADEQRARRETRPRRWVSRAKRAEGE